MDNINLQALYQEAAQGAHQPAHPPLAFLMIKQYSNTLVHALRNEGFTVEHDILTAAPQAQIKVTIEGDAHTFHLAIPEVPAKDGKSAISYKMVLSGNADGSMTEFSTHNDDGSVPITRFNNTTMALAKHIVIECGRKIYQQQAHMLRMSQLAGYTV